MRPDESRPGMICSGKVSYPDMPTALIALSAMNRRGGYGEQNAFRCPHCGAVHIGHPPHKSKRIRLKMRRC